MTQTVLQQTMDDITSPAAIPVSKLDADQYVAEDLDGVTENMFGSGNLNFLLMQAGQANSLEQTSQPFSILGENASGGPGLSAGSALGGVSSSSGNEFSYGDGFWGGSEISGTAADASAGSITGASAAIPVATAASLGGGLFSSNHAYAGFTPSVNGVNGTDGQTASAINGIDGTNGAGGLNGTDGQDGSSGGDTIVNEFIDLTEVIELGDVIINLGDINLGDIIIDLGDLTIIDLGDVTNIITTTVTDITNIITNILDGGITLNLDAILSNITDLDLDLILGDTVFNLVDQIIDLSPITDLLEPILDLDGLIIGEIHSGFSLFEDGGHQHQPGDTDIGLGLDTVLGDLPLLNGVTDIILNPAEDILGDIDILADLGLDLFNNAAIDNGGGDTDLTLDLGIGALDGTLLGGNIHVPLDPLEQIVGDLDINLNAALDLLSPDANDAGIGDLLHNNDGGLSGWTENILPGLNDLFGDPGSHGIENILPAPVGDIAEGLGGLLGGLHSNGGGLLGGGLFG